MSNVPHHITGRRPPFSRSPSLKQGVGVRLLTYAAAIVLYSFFGFALWLGIGAP